MHLGVDGGVFIARDKKKLSPLRAYYIFSNTCTNPACFKVFKASWTCEFSRLIEENRSDTPQRDRIETS